MPGYHWTTAEETLLETLEGRYIGQDFIQRYRYIADRNGYRYRSNSAIEEKARRMNISLAGGLFDE